jgi:hypothetical protein
LRFCLKLPIQSRFKFPIPQPGSSSNYHVFQSSLPRRIFRQSTSVQHFQDNESEGRVSQPIKIQPQKTPGSERSATEQGMLEMLAVEDQSHSQELSICLPLTRLTFLSVLSERSMQHLRWLGISHPSEADVVILRLHPNTIG